VKWDETILLVPDFLKKIEPFEEEAFVQSTQAKQNQNNYNYTKI